MPLFLSLEHPAPGVPPILSIEQRDSFSEAIRHTLAAVAKGIRCVDGVIWHAPATGPVVLALREAGHLLGEEVIETNEVQTLAHTAVTANDQESAVRKLIQKYMDRQDLAVAPYTTHPNIEPWRHQQLAYHWGMRVPSFYIAHKPGLGKTRTALDIVRGRMELGWVTQPRTVWNDEYQRWGIEGGVLIVCPKVVLGNWKSEAMKWQNIPATITVSTSRETKQRRAATPTWIHICTYGSLANVVHNRYSGIICDEMHFCAWDDTKTWERVLAVREQASWIIGLSGTPLSNMLPSLWAQYYLLDYGRSLGTTFTDYERRYFDGSNRNLTAKESAIDAISGRIGRITYFLTMSEAFPDKAPKIHQVIRVTMTREQRRYYELVRNKAKAEIQTGAVEPQNQTVRLVKLLQIAQGFVRDDDGNIQEFSSAKLDALRQMLTGAGDLADHRVIIWVSSRHELGKIEAMLTSEGKKTLVLHGGMHDAEREAAKNAWNTDATYRCFVGMIQIGIGINLHAPDCVNADGTPAKSFTTIYFGLDWSVTKVEQSMDRTYRGDQTEACLYRYLLTDPIESDDGEPVTIIDENVYNVLQRKLEQATMLSEGSVDYYRQLIG